jgi:photoactive yellow protein
MLSVEELATARPEELDRLPFGVIRLARGGRIEAYSAAEEALSGKSRGDVVGKNFFREVAPCTGVAAFEGEVQKLYEGAGGKRASFTFVFKFPGGAVMVSIAATHNVATDTVTLLVQATP